MIKVIIDIPDRLVDLYDSENDTELTNEEYLIAEVKRIAYDAIDRRVRDVHRQSAEVLTEIEKT